MADKKEESSKVTFNFNKLKDFSAWYERIVNEGIMDKRYPVKGMPVFTAYGYYCHCKIMEILEQEWEKLGHDKVQFPVLIPKSYLEQEADHIAGFAPEVFWATKGGDKDLEMPCALRPTSETAMYNMFSLWVQTYRDLPLKVHQTCAVYRYETKDTLPLIRAREIHWNEAHTCHSSEADALANLEAAWKSYLYLINDVLGVYGLRLRRPEWDRFAGAVHTDVLDCVLPSGKVLQAVGAHYLGQGFAKAFNIKFTNDKQQPEFGYLTCYGVSTRLLACTISSHGDNKGLVLPNKIAKHQVVIVPIVIKKRDADIKKAAQELLATLVAGGIRGSVDDADKTPGEKYYHHEKLGVPIRIELGPRDVDNKKFVAVLRHSGEKIEVPLDQAVAKVKELLENQDTTLRTKSLQFHNEHVTTCKTLEEAVQALATKGGFARVPFWTDSKDGHDGDKFIHSKTGGEVRGFISNEAKPEGLTCVATGKPATVWAYVARTY